MQLHNALAEIETLKRDLKNAQIKNDWWNDEYESLCSQYWQVSNELQRTKAKNWELREVSLHGNGEDVKQRRVPTGLHVETVIRETR